MPKRKRPDSATHSGKHVCLSLESRRPKPCRRSARLQKIEPQQYARRVDELCQLPSPTASNADTANGRKRKQAASETILLADKAYSKRRKLLQPDAGTISTEPYNPIKHWVHTQSWPPNLWQKGFKMSNTPSSKRRSESSSSHRSQTVERMAVHGVFMESSHLIQKPSRDLCDKYLKGDRKAVKTSVFSARDFEEVLNRVRNLNEARIQRDVTPWVVPSVETLFFRGDFQLDWVGEELNAEWIRCATMGSTTPKPDYAAGLLRCAFTEEEMQKLDNYATPTQPCRFTPNLCFPFLVCEAKTGEKGMNEADRQNIHGASIAVRAIIMLYREAFGTTDPSRVHSLHGQVLVFTVSHDNDRVFLYGHFAVIDSSLPSGLKFYRHPIALYSLTTNGGADRLKAYNFVRNVYDRFAPAHRKRIRDALAHIPNPSERTGLSFAASDISLDPPDSQQDPFRRPRAPSSTSQQSEMGKLRKQLEQQKQESNQQTDKLLHQMEQQRQQMEQQLRQQRQDSKDQMKQQQRQMEQQRQQAEQQRQQAEQQRQQAEQQRQQMEEQLQQQRQDSKDQMKQQQRQMEQQLRQQSEIISLLKSSSKSSQQ